jgi:hypothetical protein
MHLVSPLEFLIAFAICVGIGAAMTAAFNDVTSRSGSL